MAETPPEELPPLQYAAVQSRLPYENLTAQETALFADVLKVNTATVTKLLVYIRNRILQLWLADPKRQLLMENAIKQLEAPYTSQDRPLAQKMFAFLERQSYLNFGVFERIKVASSPTKKRVIIIGAGIAGITAAQQLTFFGFDVVILEARDYVGGRIATYKRNNYIGELGAMVVTGLLGNPIAVLAKQIPNLDLQDVKALVQLFDPTGNKLAPEKDHRVHQEFLRLLEASNYLSKELDFNYVNNQPIALGQALEWLIKLQEKRVKEKQVDHWKNIIELQEKMKANQRAMRNLKEHMAKIFAAQKDLGETKNQRSINEEFIFRSKIYDLKQCVKEWESLNEERAKMENKLEELEKNPPTDVYLSAQDRQVLDWHFANLESANSATLDDLSLRNWDLDEEFKGANKIIRSGFTVIPLTMARGLDVKLSTAVKQVRYTNQGVEILAQSTKSSGAEASPSLETFTGDAVLCTLPLGVLKQTDPSGNNVVSFLPALPDWKMAAVNKMGYGNQNKVLLGFDKIFWEQNLPVFGHIGSTTASRGELFTFFTISPKTPVLLALVSGEAANIMEEVNDDVIVGRCIAVLKGMYGLGNVPQPKDTVVTRWRKDPYARGSFSYVAKGASGQEFDQLAEPVCVPFTENDAPAAKQPRLFFAGEHTSRKYFSTVHGALLSGLREAARIADTFLGPVTTPK